MDFEDISLPSPPSISQDSDEGPVYEPVPAKEWPGIYPPVLPPPDFFDLEEVEKKLKYLFKYDNDKENPLHDETGQGKLLVDEKGIMIIDPVSRTRLIDAVVEDDIMGGYMDWMTSVMREMKKPDSELNLRWMNGLRDAVSEDQGTLLAEWETVVDEERMKHGLTTFGENFARWKKKTRREQRDLTGIIDAKQEDQTESMAQFPPPDFLSSDEEGLLTS